MNRINIGVIGIGTMGSSYCKTILSGIVPGLKLTAVAAHSEARQNWAREHLPSDIAVFAEGTELIDSGLCDAVLVAVPHYRHPEISVYAMKKGLHVLCDKPAGVYTRQVREMNAAALESGVVFGMMFNQRTNGLYRKIYEIIQSNKLGEIKRINWIVTDWYRTQSYYDSGSWRATWAGEGGGVLLNQCPHQLDLFQWFFGLPSKVRAFCHNGKWHDIEVEDDVTAYFEFENGATGVFIASTGDAPGTNRLEITFDKGKLLSENGKLYLWKLATSEREFCYMAEGGFDQPACEFEKLTFDSQNDQHAGVMKAFAGNILQGTPLIAEGKDGILSLMLSNAMHLSSWTEQTISLPFDEELYFNELQKRCASSRPKNSVSKIMDVEKSFHH